MLPDIHEAAAALAAEHDAIALVRLSLAAAECNVRDYHQRVSGDFLELLIDLGHQDAALAHVRHISDNTADNDRTVTALDLVVAMHDRGLIADAARLFAEYEPIELLANRGGSRRNIAGHRGPWRTLYAWGAAAALVHGPQYVVEQTERLVLTRADLDRGEDVDKATALVRANILWSAAETIAPRTGQDAADQLLAALPPNGPAPQVRAAVLVRRARDAWRSGDAPAAAALLDAVLAGQPASLRDRDTALEAAELLLHLGRPDDARGIAAALPAVSVPPSGRGDDDDSDWRRLLRRLRLQATLDGPLDPAATIPDGEHDYEHSRVVVARHIVRFANLWARHLRGEMIAASEVAAVVAGVLRLWDGGSQRDRRDLWSALGGRRTIVEGAVVLARDAGPEALQALWRWWQERWSTPRRARDGGLELVRTFHEAGIGPVSLRARLGAYTAAVARDPDADVETWTELAWARLAADDEGGARTALERGTASTFVVGFRKDYQLSTWIRLLRPLLDGSRGPGLAGWLADRVADLNRRAEAGAAKDAAKTLCAVAGQARPADVLDLARSLRDRGVRDVDDVVEAVLQATAEAADDAWWTVLSEILVPLGGGPIALDAACAATTDRDTVARRLRAVADRVAIEGRPTERRAWRQALIDAARTRGLAARALGIALADLELGDETPNREPSETGPDDDDDEEQITEPVEDLLARLEAGDRGYDGLRPVVARLGELDRPQRDRLLALANDDEQFTPLAAALAVEAMDDGRIDDAWTWAEKALARSSGGDWRRYYAGGLALDAIRLLYRLDAARARRLVFERVAAVAGEDQFLLGGVADDLDRMIDLFGPFDETAAAEAVLEYVIALSGVPGPPSADDAEPPAAAPPRDSVTPAVCAQLTGWLLGMIHLLAWSSAQRAALGLLRVGGSAAAAVEDALLDGGALIPPERVLTVLASALDDPETSLPDPAPVLAWVTRQATGPRLDLRFAAADLLRRLGAPVPTSQPRPLPPALQLVVSRAPEVLSGAAAIGAGDLDEMLGYGEDEIARLAKAADVDPDALEEYVRARAAERAARMPTDKELGAEQTILGWGFVRPSASAVEAAQQEVAAELVDASRLEPAVALAELRTLRRGSADLLARRPQRRPSCVVAAASLADRTVMSDEWLDGIDDAVDRLAIVCDGWTVIAELTELSLLDRRHSRELRDQALVPQDADALYTPVRLPLGEARRAAGLWPGAGLIMRNAPAGLGFGDGFIGLHPAAARAAGLTPDDADPLAWHLDGETVVRSIWWRSGFAYWPPYSRRDEVGNGWLVIARPPAVTALAQAFPSAEIRWEVRRRGRDEDGGGELPGREIRGSRILATS